MAKYQSSNAVGAVAGEQDFKQKAVSQYPTNEVAITLQKGTVKVSENVQVNVIDSSTFQVAFGKSDAEKSNLAVNKKNFKKKLV